MMKKASVAIGFAAAAAATASAIPCATTCKDNNDFFKPISASEWVEAANPGWNAGNTLDAVPSEGSWNNPPLAPSTLDYIQAAGYKAVRIPVTYADHFVSGSPDWTINSTWLQRVSDVVDMATSKGLYVITNMHHDVSQVTANQTMIQEKLYASWLQIGKTLACKSSMVALEPINEPPGSTAADGANLMRLNDLFLKALADSGGYNAKRVVTLSGPTMGIDGIKFFTAPKNATNPWAFQFHYYSPYDFDFGAWGKTVWGSDADKAAMTTDFGYVHGNFTDVPVVMGEFDASQLNCEAAARWKWFDHVVRTSHSLGFAGFLWDNGLDNLDRATGIWRDATAVNITMKATKGEQNSLADSTTDPAATSQNSSAYVFHKTGDGVTEQTLPFILNGNTFKTLMMGSTMLKEGSDYAVSGSNLVFKQSLLSTIFSASSGAGSKENVTVTFSQGAPSQVELVQWDTPTFGSYSGAAKDVPAGADLWIPVVWKGLHKVAAVKIQKSDGAYLVDDWTQYLPTLQQGRGTYGSQWSFDQDRVTITRAAVDAVIASGTNTTFTFEFYPRAAANGNYVNYTLTV
ncbi:glycoside hydrolase [Diplogelasinospora grovesii]|uniref:Glycoside hydrolase n=1 Tax=Diplogelasinospora grovesii TaxID=303347 RepID=A0AAN6S735_9PEZI|nr:glycoside hydrolase [Diplogelasinospora grovesii]